MCLCMCVYICVCVCVYIYICILLILFLWRTLMNILPYRGDLHKGLSPASSPENALNTHKLLTKSIALESNSHKSVLALLCPIIYHLPWASVSSSMKSRNGIFPAISVNKGHHSHHWLQPQPMVSWWTPRELISKEWFQWAQTLVSSHR